MGLKRRERHDKLSHIIVHKDQEDLGFGGSIL